MRGASGGGRVRGDPGALSADIPSLAAPSTRAENLGADNIAKTTRAIRDEPERALTILGITNILDT
jgi:hypothetical protein